jgi:hypothetical protein
MPHGVHASCQFSQTRRPVFHVSKDLQVGATAEQILASVDSLVDEIQEQRERASQLKAEAAALKKGGELRELEGGIVEELHAVPRTADDRYQGCDRPRTIWRYNRSR